MHRLPLRLTRAQPTLASRPPRLLNTPPRARRYRVSMVFYGADTPFPRHLPPSLELQSSGLSAAGVDAGVVAMLAAARRQMRSLVFLVHRSEVVARAGGAAGGVVCVDVGGGGRGKRRVHQISCVSGRHEGRSQSTSLSHCSRPVCHPASCSSLNVLIT